MGKKLAQVSGPRVPSFSKSMKLSAFDANTDYYAFILIQTQDSVN